MPYLARPRPFLLHSPEHLSQRAGQRAGLHVQDRRDVLEVAVHFRLVHLPDLVPVAVEDRLQDGELEGKVRCARAPPVRTTGI